jgi:hypothetical protein
MSNVSPAVTESNSEAEDLSVPTEPATSTADDDGGSSATAAISEESTALQTAAGGDHADEDPNTGTAPDQTAAAPATDDGISAPTANSDVMVEDHGSAAEDLAHLLSDLPCTVTTTGLDIAADATPEQVKEVGRRLHRAGTETAAKMDIILWSTGDWLLKRSHKVGKKWQEATALVDERWTTESLKKIQRVADRFEKCSRLHSVPFWTHEVIGRVKDPEVRLRLLEWADREGWSQRQAEEEAKAANQAVRPAGGSESADDKRGDEGGETEEAEGHDDAGDTQADAEHDASDTTSEGADTDDGGAETQSDDDERAGHKDRTETADDEKPEEANDDSTTDVVVETAEDGNEDNAEGAAEDDEPQEPPPQTAAVEPKQVDVMVPAPLPRRQPEVIAVADPRWEPMRDHAAAEVAEMVTTIGEQIQSDHAICVLQVPLTRIEDGLRVFQETGFEFQVAITLECGKRGKVMCFEIHHQQLLIGVRGCRPKFGKDGKYISSYSKADCYWISDKVKKWLPEAKVMLVAPRG